jgi:hypothetical protein
MARMNMSKYVESRFNPPNFGEEPWTAEIQVKMVLGRCVRD